MIRKKREEVLTVDIFFGATAGLVWGVLAAFLSYCIMNKCLKKNTANAMMLCSVLRTAVDVAALGAVFLARNLLPFSFYAAIIATAVALSVSTIYFTFRLARNK